MHKGRVFRSRLESNAVGWHTYSFRFEGLEGSKPATAAHSPKNSKPATACFAKKICRSEFSSFPIRDGLQFSIPKVRSFASFGSADERHQTGGGIHLGLPSRSFSIPSLADFVRNPSVTSLTRDQRSPSIADFVLDLGQDHHEAQPTPYKQRESAASQPWAKVIIVMAFTIVVGLLSVNYTINGNDNLTPANLFSGRPMSFGFFLMVVMVTFHVAVIAMIIRLVLPVVAKVLNIIAFVCVVLGVTVLLWALLPRSFSWVPWIFFRATIFVSLGVIVYEWLQYVKRVKAISAVQRAITFGSQP